jgi:hypothetical protein
MLDRRLVPVAVGSPPIGKLTLSAIVMTVGLAFPPEIEMRTQAQARTDAYE